MQVMREEKYCIKIRSLFNIRKEKKISFKRGKIYILIFQIIIYRHY